MNEPLIYKGDVVQCPRCSIRLYTVERDIHRGDYLSAEYFNPIGLVPEPINGQRCDCIECGAAWAAEGKIHLKKYGWL